MQLPLHFMIWNERGKPIQLMISFWLWAKRTRGRLSATRDYCKDSAIKNMYIKNVFILLLPSSFKIFMNMFTFLYVNTNVKEICEERSFASFFTKMLMSAFLLRFRANYLEFFLDSNNPYKDLLFCMVLIIWRTNLCV